MARPCTKQTAGLLTRRSSRVPAFPGLPSGCRLPARSALAAYSDGIVQASHLFPYYPPRPPGVGGTVCFTLFNFLHAPQAGHGIIVSV